MKLGDEKESVNAEKDPGLERVPGHRQERGRLVGETMAWFGTC